MPNDSWKEKIVGDAGDMAKDHFTQGELDFIASELTKARESTKQAIIHKMRMEQNIYDANNDIDGWNFCESWIEKIEELPTPSTNGKEK